MTTGTSAPRAVGAIGVRQPLIDGVEKVTGQARYTADLPAAGALVGAILRSPVAHGEIRRIDVSRARALPGVRAIVTGADCAVAYGVIPVAQNEFPLARERVRAQGLRGQQGTPCGRRLRGHDRRDERIRTRV